MNKNREKEIIDFLLSLRGEEVELVSEFFLDTLREALSQMDFTQKLLFMENKLDFRLPTVTEAELLFAPSNSQLN